ncbi:MAG: hypothetical protein U1F43_37850 [Myxococcota bacterium]
MTRPAKLARACGSWWLRPDAGDPVPVHRAPPIGDLVATSRLAWLAHVPPGPLGELLDQLETGEAVEIIAGTQAVACHRLAVLAELAALPAHEVPERLRRLREVALSLGEAELARIGRSR